jgi:hypothetical protein
MKESNMPIAGPGTTTEADRCDTSGHFVTISLP